jgi:hypothetical protein
MIKIYGSGDSLIVVEGDINKEFEATEEEHYVSLSNGMLIKFSFDDAVWKITVEQEDDNDWTIEPAEEQQDVVSDVFVLDEDCVDWVMFGILAKA